MDHLEPFQRSTNVLKPPLNEPRAIQNIRDVQDTPISALDVEPAGLGVRWIDQLFPFQRSARGTSLPPTLWTPTAVQTFVERHDTALSAPLPGEGTLLHLAAVAGAALARHSANATQAPCARPTIRVQFTSPIQCVSGTLLCVPSWFHVRTSPVSVRPVMTGPVPGILLESTVCSPVASDAWICSTLQGVVSAQELPAIRAGVHADGPPVGLVEVTTWPVVSAATQSDADGQAIEFRSRPSSIMVCVHPPEAGLVDTSSTPDKPTARQSVVEGQAIPSRYPPAVCFVHVPAVGSVVVCKPARPTAAQKPVVGHVPDSNGGVLVLTLQAPTPPVGSAEVKTVRTPLMKHLGCVEQKIVNISRLRSI
jgi:hypothetical protein